MKHFTKTAILMLLVVVTTSCSDTLSKEEAKAIISEKYPTYCTSHKIVKSFTFWADSNSRERNKKQKILNLLKDLEQQGLVTIVVKNSGFTSNPDRNYSYKLTDKARELYDGKVALMLNELVEIVGISQNENEATVKYKIKSVKTPFYVLHEAYTKKPECREREWEKDITLVKFDTGWKIK